MGGRGDRGSGRRTMVDGGDGRSRQREDRQWCRRGTVVDGDGWRWAAAGRAMASASLFAGNGVDRLVGEMAMAVYIKAT